MLDQPRFPWQTLELWELTAALAVSPAFLCSKDAKQELQRVTEGWVGVFLTVGGRTVFQLIPFTREAGCFVWNMKFFDIQREKLSSSKSF